MSMFTATTPQLNEITGSPPGPSRDLWTVGVFALTRRSPNKLRHVTIIGFPASLGVGSGV